MTASATKSKTLQGGAEWEWAQTGERRRVRAGVRRMAQMAMGRVAGREGAPDPVDTCLPRQGPQAGSLGAAGRLSIPVIHPPP